MHRVPWRAARACAGSFVARLSSCHALNSIAERHAHRPQRADGDKKESTVCDVFGMERRVRPISRSLEAPGKILGGGGAMTRKIGKREAKGGGGEPLISHRPPPVVAVKEKRNLDMAAGSSEPRGRMRP